MDQAVFQQELEKSLELFLYKEKGEKLLKNAIIQPNTSGSVKAVVTQTVSLRGLNGIRAAN